MRQYAWPAAGALLRFAWCGQQSAGCCMLLAPCCLLHILTTVVPHSPPTVPPARQQGPAVLVNMAFVILGLAFTTEAMSTFDRMLTATDELWFEIAVDTDRDGNISPEEIAAATGGSISKSLSMRSLRRLDEASRRTVHTCDTPDEIAAAAILNEIMDGSSSAASGANVAAGAGEQPKGGARESNAVGPAENSNVPQMSDDAAAVVNPAENSNVPQMLCAIAPRAAPLSLGAVKGADSFGRKPVLSQSYSGSGKWTMSIQ